MPHKAKRPLPVFFPAPALFRKWLHSNHRTAQELFVGYYKRSTGKPSMTWPESVDQALCYGWIDGIRRSIDEERYMIRFTPRKQASHWSDVNIRRVAELRKLGQMRLAGEEAFARRTEARSRRGRYEIQSFVPDEKLLSAIRKHTKAWRWFSEQPPSYRRQTLWWVASAKKEETRERRLGILIDSSTAGEIIPPLRWTRK